MLALVLLLACGKTLEPPETHQPPPPRSERVVAPGASPDTVPPSCPTTIVEYVDAGIDELVTADACPDLRPWHLAGASKYRGGAAVWRVAGKNAFLAASWDPVLSALDPDRPDRHRNEEGKVRLAMMGGGCRESGDATEFLASVDAYQLDGAGTDNAVRDMKGTATCSPALWPVKIDDGKIERQELKPLTGKCRVSPGGAYQAAAAVELTLGDLTLQPATWAEVPEELEAAVCP